MINILKNMAFSKPEQALGIIQEVTHRGKVLTIQLELCGTRGTRIVRRLITVRVVLTQVPRNWGPRQNSESISCSKCHTKFSRNAWNILDSLVVLILLLT